MAWTTPPTFTAGTVLTAANLNILSDDLTYLKAITDGVTVSGVQVTKSSQSISNSTTTNISFSTEVFDYGGWWSSGTAITVPSGAIPSGFTTIVVLVAARVRWAASGTGARTVRLAKNGTEFGRSTTSGISGETLDQQALDFVEVVAGDTIALEVVQSSGGALTADTAQITVMRYAPAA